MPFGFEDRQTVDEISDLLADLTPREKDVLRHLLDGRRKSEIGRSLGISPKTVDVYRANLLAKLGASNTPRMIARVLAYQFALTTDRSRPQAGRVTQGANKWIS